MKKYFVFAAAALTALASCSKVEVDQTVAKNDEINFQVANYVAQTKAEGDPKPNSVYSENIPFGTYAWFYDGTVDADNKPIAQTFMNNQEISNQTISGKKVWKATGLTYYWPRTGSLTFVSYSPFAKKDKVTVDADKITITGYDAISDINVNSEQALLLLADKVSGVTAKTNADGGEITSGTAATNNYSGVPTLFRNALAKLSFAVKTSSTSMKATKINSVKITNVFRAGNAILTANTDGKWIVASAANANVWTGATKYVGTEETKIYEYAETITGVGTDAVPCAVAKDIIVIPQALIQTDESADNPVYGQTITINATIEETLPNGKDKITYTTDFVGNLYSSALPSWEINKHITYTITLSQGGEVTFDPAVAPMDEVTGSVTAIGVNPAE